jgi:hypothetical protein
MKLRILVAGLLIGVAAFAADSGAELFQKAKTQEQAAGNLEEAIRLYQQVAKNFAQDRALAAKALVAEARCYEKLGQDKADKARKLYEQVERDYRDQHDPAAAASARLVEIRQSKLPAAVTMTQRKIELPGDYPFYDDTDGHNVIFRDSTTGALMRSDLAGGGKRLVFKPKEPVMVVFFMVSRDFSLVLMTLTKPDKSSTYAVVRTDGTGYHEIARDGNWSGTAQCAADISWDNSSALICMRQPGEPAQLERISLADGQILNLLPNVGTTSRFSPDGRFFAYRNSNEGVLVMPSQGGEPQLVADRDSHFIDWTRDGRHLIVEVLDGTTDALYLIPIRDGRQAGERTLLRYGKFGRGRTTASGALIYETAPQSGSLETWLGKLDPVGGAVNWEKLSLTGNQNTIAEHRPTWSPDSNQIAYMSYVGPGASTVALRLRNMASGVERQLYKGDLLLGCFWSAQRPNIFCLQRDEKSASQVLSISTDTGRAESLGALPDGFREASPMLISRDDVAIYFSSSKLGLVRWEPGSSTWTTVAEGPGFRTPSPDERWVVRSENGKEEIRPMAGGDWRPLAPDTKAARDVLTADGNWLVYTGLEATGKTGLFRVATSGGEPTRLGELPTTNFLSNMWMSPDGQTVFADFQTSHEIWMMENFEPKQQTLK